VEYVDRVQEFNTATQMWDINQLIFASANADINYFENDLGFSTPVESYPCRLSVDYILAFLKL